MATLDLLRFADAHVRQRIPTTAATRVGEACDWPKLAARYVQNGRGRMPPVSIVATIKSRPRSDRQ